MYANRIDLPAWLLAGELILGAPICLADENPVTADQVVTAIEHTFGVTPGERRNHTKGVCAAGEFVGTHEAATYSRSAIFSGRPVPVTARFSLAGGN
ncbi:MAG: catalase, partial [Betaproteobacteria bacterium]